MAYHYISYDAQPALCSPLDAIPTNEMTTQLHVVAEVTSSNFAPIVWAEPAQRTPSQRSNRPAHALHQATRHHS